MNWQTALQLGRVSNLPTVWTNTLTAVVLVGVGAADTRVWMLLIAMSLYYVGGMYLNDAFDAEIDAVERPERPIPSGAISRSTVYTAGFGMLGLATILVQAVATMADRDLGLWPLASGVALAGMIILYNGHHKANPLSPFVMGLCRALVYITSGLCFVLALPSELWFAVAVVLCYLIGLTYVAKQENFGRVENLWPLVFLAAPLVYGLSHISSEPIVILFLAGLTAWISFAVWLVQRRQAGDIPRAVISLIAGISLLDALLITSAGHFWTALIAVAGFLLTLFLQRYISGT
jgi:hypothetical protein